MKLVRHQRRGYSQAYINIGKPLMSLWQITVIAFLGAIAALLGAVVIYAKALTNEEYRY